MRQKKKCIVVFLGFIFLFSVLVFSEDNPNISDLQSEKKNPNPSDIQYTDGSLTLSQNFSMLEFSEVIDTKENVSLVNVNLGSSKWNLTNIKANFTDIKFAREILDVETEETGTREFVQITPPSSPYARSIQLNITESTLIYGANIYGKAYAPDAGDFLYIQLRGYDSLLNAPNNTIYRSKRITDMTADEKWYNYTFDSPVELSRGNYSLVLNLTNSALGKIKYYWYYNEDTPSNPNLYTSVSDGTTWEQGIQGSPFLFKLDQKISEVANPEDINMTALINGTFYPILNDADPQTGNITLQNLDFFINSDHLIIPIKNNKSSALTFNVSYSINLKNEFITGGSLKISNKTDNIWTLEHVINKYSNNYSMRFYFPESWYTHNITVNDVNVTDQVIINNIDNYIYVDNDTLVNNTNLKIVSKSLKTGFILDVPGTNFNVGQTLIFDITAPVKLGNYTFILEHSLGSMEYNETREIASPVTFSFQYSIPLNAYTGTWITYVFWNNETNAGVQTQAFQITGASGSGTTVLGGDNDDGSDSTTATDYFIMLVVIIVIGIVGASSFASYTAYKRVMKTRERQRETLHDKFTDILSLNHVIVIDKKSGLNVFEQFFGGKSMDATLISGFLDAIRSFGLELTGSYRQTQTIALEYQNSKVLMSEYKNFRLILIMAERPSQEFLNSIDSLSYDIDVNFGEQLKNFGGNIKAFEDIKDLISNHLNTAFISPLKVLIPPDVKLKPAEKSMTNKAKQLMKQNNLTYFYTTFLMSDQAFNPRDTEIIFNLIDKKIFQPTDITLT